MRCIEALERIDLSLTGDLGTIAALRLRHHVYGCRSCYAELRRARQVHGVLDDYVTHLRPATSLRDRVLRDVASTPAPITAAFAPERAHRPWIAPLVAAAAVLVAAFALWAILSNRAVTDDILARVTRIEGRALYTAPGERAAVPLGLDDVVVSDGRVESPDDDASAFETDGGEAHYDVGPGGAFRLRRGDRGAIVVYERGSVGISTRRAGVVQEVRTPGGVVVPQDDAMALAIAPFPARDNAHRIELRRGRVEVRNADGTLALDAPNVAIVAAGFAPEPWSEPAPPVPPVIVPPAVVASSRKRTPDSETTSQAPVPPPTTPKVAVSEFEQSVLALMEFARDHTFDYTVSHVDALQSGAAKPLVERYARARNALIDQGEEVIEPIVAAASNRSDAVVALLGCANAIAARAGSDAEAKKIDRVMSSIIEQDPTTLGGWYWIEQLSLFSGPITQSRLWDAIVSPDRIPLVRVDQAIAWLSYSWLFETMIGGHRNVPSFSRSLMSEYSRHGTDDAGVRLNISRLLFAMHATRELAEIASSEKDQGLLARLNTYVAIERDNPDHRPAITGRLLSQCVADPGVILSRGLDPETTLELLLRSDGIQWRGRAPLSNAWVLALESTCRGGKSTLSRDPSELLQRLAASILARATGCKADVKDATRILGVEAKGYLVRRTFLVSFLTALEELSATNPADKIVEQARREFRAELAATAAGHERASVGDMIRLRLDWDATSPRARRFGVLDPTAWREGGPR